MTTYPTDSGVCWLSGVFSEFIIITVICNGLDKYKEFSY